jgi:hypothetical protein
MFEDAVRRAPSETKKAVFLRYAKFEEFGRTRHEGLRGRSECWLSPAATGSTFLHLYDVYVKRVKALFSVRDPKRRPP